MAEEATTEAQKVMAGLEGNEGVLPSRQQSQEEQTSQQESEEPKGEEGGGEEEPAATPSEGAPKQGPESYQLGDENAAKEFIEKETGGGEESEGGEGKEEGEEQEQKEGSSADTYDKDTQAPDERSEIEKRLGLGAGEADGKTIEDIDGLTQKAKEELGLEVEKPEDVLNSLKDYKEKAEKAGNKEKELNDMQNMLDQLPEELQAGIQAYMNGEDHLQIINSRPNLDFSKAKDDIPKADLVKTYYPDQFDGDDIEAIREGTASEDLQKRFDLASQEAGKKFEGDKNKHQEYLKDQQKKLEQHQEKFNESLQNAEQEFKRQFPNADPKYIEEVREQLSNPALLFYNEDGSLRKDAFKRLAFGKDGDQLLDQYKQQVKREEQNKTKREALKGTPSKPDKNKQRTRGQGQGQKELSPEAKATISGLFGLTKNSQPTY